MKQQNQNIIGLIEKLTARNLLTTVKYVKSQIRLRFIQNKIQPDSYTKYLV